MTTESAQKGQDEAQKIWAELDAIEAGLPAPAAAAPLAVETPAKEPDKQEAKPEAAAPAAPADKADAAAGADPEKQTLLDKINGLESQLQGALTRVRQVEGRYGELNSRMEKSAREVTAAAGAAAPSATQLREAQQNPEKMADLKRDYPEFASAMEAALDERLSGMKQELQELRERSAQPGVVTVEDVQSLRNEFTVELAHAGWKETVKQPEFAGWLGRQPREVQLLAASDSPQDAIRLLDLHAEARKAAGKTNNTRRLETAAAIPSGRSTTERAKPVEEMSAEEYWRYLDQQDAQKARQQG